MLQYHKNAARDMPTASMHWHKSSVRAPDPRKVQSWRTAMSNDDRIIFEQIAGDALRLFGYETGPLIRTFTSRLKFAKYSLLGHS